MNNNEVVETITQSIVPVYAHANAYTESNKFRLTLQGDDTEVGTHVTTTFQEESVGDVQLADNSTNAVALTDSTPDLQLGSFLARPVAIDSFSWSTTDPVGVTRTILPWKLYLNTTSVKNKLNNYAFLRGKLHMKVVINATPFQYGSLRACYFPLKGLSGTDRIRTNASTDTVLRTPYSQLPGCYISPQTNEGGEIEAPFLYHKNWVDITSATNVDNLGSLSFVTFAPLNIAIATAPTSITVRTIAWMSDVELMGATSDLALQGDEYGQGSVSKPATAVASVAGMLTKVPIIGPFARATQIGASAVAGIASLFGFTNPPVLNDVKPVYVMSAPQLATTEISVPYQKLAYDPKAELSIDSSFLGATSEDELSINYLKKKETFFGAASWATTDAEATQIFNAKISPTLRGVTSITNSVAATVGYRHYNTPLSHLSYMFRHWRGSLRVRMLVIASKYHKGRVKVSWDPLGDITATNPDLNVCYNQIVDIGDTHDVVFDIPYHQAKAWLLTDTNDNSSGWTTGGSNPPDDNYHNGVLSVRVFNTLEAPSAAPVTLLFYVSGGDDFEFNNPKGGISSGSSCPTPSFFALQGEEVDEHQVGTKPTVADNRYHQNFGEAVLSLRKILHRSSIVDTVPLPNGTVSATNLYRKGIFRIPYTPGFYSVSFPTQANKVVAASGTANYAFNTMHPIPWVASMFLGTRGSVNYTLTVNSPKVVPDDIRVTRISDNGAITATNRVINLVTSIPGTDTLSKKCSRLGQFYFSRDGTAGMAQTSARAAPSVQFNVQDYNNCNFTLVDPLSYVEGSTIDETDIQGALVQINIANTTTTDELGYSTVVTNAGTGVDFTCFYFMCCPTVDNLIGDPTPV